MVALEYHAQQMPGPIPLADVLEDILAGGAIRTSLALHPSSCEDPRAARLLLTLLDRVRKAEASRVDGFAQVRDAVAETAHGAQAVADVALRARAKAAALTTAAERSVMTLNEAMDGLQRITEVIAASAKAVNVLGSASAGIEEFSSIIQELSERTDLLALNASIEAARSGVHGRAFAVIAREMHALADKTRAQNAKIAAAVGRVSEIATSARVRSASNQQHIGDVGARAVAAQSDLATMVELIDRSFADITEITATCEHQATALETLAATIPAT